MQRLRPFKPMRIAHLAVKNKNVSWLAALLPGHACDFTALPLDFFKSLILAQVN